MMAAYLYYLPKGTPASVLGFWRPERGKGPVQNDCWSICSTTKKPVLAHLWMNYILDYNNAYSNFVNFNGYQPPMKALNPADLVKNKVIPENLANVRSDRGRLRPDLAAGDDPELARSAALAKRLRLLPGRIGGGTMYPRGCGPASRFRASSGCCCCSWCRSMR